MNEARCHADAHVIGLANSHLHFMFNGIHLSHALNPYVSNVFVARRACSLMMSTWHAVQWRHQTKSSAQMYSVLVLGQYCDSWFDWMIDCLGVWMFFYIDCVGQRQTANHACSSVWHIHRLSSVWVQCFPFHVSFIEYTYIHIRLLHRMTERICTKSKYK